MTNWKAIWSKRTRSNIFNAREMKASSFRMWRKRVQGS